MGICASQPRTHPGGEGGAYAVKPPDKLQGSTSLGRSAAAAAAAAQPSVCLDAAELDDDTFGEVLSQLPLLHLLQLSSASKRLFQLVHRSDKVLKSVDLQPLLPHKLEPALSFLRRHPAADSIHTAVLPSNCASSAATIAALSGLQQLTLYRSGKVPFPEPEVTSLALDQLQHLTALSIMLASGDVPAGQKLKLPGTLQELRMSAPTFGSAINPLELEQLDHLRDLRLNVLDSNNSNSLAKLLALPSLQHLSLGRFWSLPDVLHSFSGLRSLEVFVYGKVLHAPMGDLESPLSAAACGLCNLPTRPNLHLQVHVSVLSECDGLAPDWSSLANLRYLQLDNIYPASSGFQLAALTELGRLHQLQLGFEAQKALAGHFQQLELHQLHHLVHLKELSVTCSGSWMELVLEAPKHLNSLLVACQGRLLLAAPGTAAAIEAAAAAQRAAQLGQQSSVVMRLSLDTCPPTPTSPSASAGSPASVSPPASPSKAAAAAAASLSHGFGSSTAAKLMAGLGGSWSANGSGLLQTGNLGSPQPSLTAGSGNSGTSDPFVMLPDLGLNDCSVMLMQRRLDRLGSIGETEEIYNQEDEAEQLSHISRLGLLTGQGICMLDPSIARSSITSTVSTSAGSASSGSMMAGRNRRRRGQSSPGAAASYMVGDAGVMPLDSWLAAKGLNLATLQLVEQQLHPQWQKSSSFSRAKGSHSSIKRASAPPAAGCGAKYSLLARQHMEEQLLGTFREWGFGN